MGPVVGAAIGVPGLFDDRTGSIELFPNLPGDWTGVPMAGPLGSALGVPTSIINDARAFTLAESRLGAAAGCDTVAALVLGTGIGGGIVVGGRLHFGRMGRAGEFAHQVIAPDGPPCGVRQPRLPRSACGLRGDHPARRDDDRARGVRRCGRGRRSSGRRHRRGGRLPRDRHRQRRDDARARTRRHRRWRRRGRRGTAVARARRDGPALRRWFRRTGTRSSPPSSANTPERSAPPCGRQIRRQVPASMTWGSSVSDVDTDLPQKTGDTVFPRSGSGGVGVDDVDDVAVGDVARLGALERAAVLVEQQAQLDEQRRARGDAEQSPPRPDRPAAPSPCPSPTWRRRRAGRARRAAIRARGRHRARLGARPRTAASSKAIGTPSASRTRSTRTTSAPAARRRSASSSGRAGVDPRRTRVATSPPCPRRAISSVNDRNTPGRRCIGRAATNVPLPRWRSTSPALDSSCSAWRTVIRLTLKRVHSSASVGRVSPGDAAPITSRRCCLDVAVAGAPR